MNEIFVLIYQPYYTNYEFYHTEEEALNARNIFKQYNPDKYAEIEKWDMVKFANWIARELSIISQPGFHIG